MPVISRKGSPKPDLLEATGEAPIMIAPLILTTAHTTHPEQ